MLRRALRYRLIGLMAALVWTTVAAGCSPGIKGTPGSGGSVGTGSGGTGGSAPAGGAAGGVAGGSGGGPVEAAGGTAGRATGQGGAASGGSPGSGSAGASGSGGASADCPIPQLVGWAAFGADGVRATTGGGNAPPARARSASELATLAGDSSPRVIEIATSFDLGATALEIRSNKTLVGVGPSVTLSGGVSIAGQDTGNMISNVVVRNLSIKGRGKTGDPVDTFAIRFAHHVWVDHCALSDASDGLLDTTRASSYVTVSWSKFWYTDPTHTHRLACLVGGGSTHADTDTGRMNATYHHNWFADLVDQRMPRVLFGKAHVFNNLYTSTGNTYCVRAANLGAILVENNHFDGVNSPHQLDESTAPAFITARGNSYINVTGDRDNGGGGTAFTTPPYPYHADDVAVVPELVRRCSGPR
jgi:pectate lyase